MRWSWLLVAGLGGCAALNPAYEDAGGTSGSGSGSADITGSDRPSESGTASVGTASGSGNASTTLDSVASTNDDSADTTDTSDSDSSVEPDVGSPGCNAGAQEVVDDAFLVSCNGGCDDENYGVTASLELWGAGEVTSALLMRVPGTEGMITGAEFSVSIIASGDALLVDPELTLRVIDPPCAWQPGEGDGEPIEGDTPGVTWANCDGEFSNPFPWNTSVLSHVDPSWDITSVVLTPERVSADEPYVVDFALNRTVPGPGPHSILLTSNLPTGEEFMVLAHESGDPPVITLKTDCL